METEDLTHRIASLIERGKGFSFEPSYDFGPMLEWMEEAFSVLAPLPEDQARFAKYSLRYKGYPQDRVLLGIDVLYNALINAILESEDPVAPITTINSKPPAAGPGDPKSLISPDVEA